MSVEKRKDKQVKRKGRKKGDKEFYLNGNGGGVMRAQEFLGHVHFDAAACKICVQL